MKQRTTILLSALALGQLLSLPLLAETREKARPSVGEEFFIVSSVDIKKKQIVLKRPTEVTELVLVNEMTVSQDEQGKPVPVKDLRAGDTVYVTTAPLAGGGRVALRIRKGPMTPEELHRRYLKSVTSE